MASLSGLRGYAPALLFLIAATGVCASSHGHRSKEEEEMIASYKSSHGIVMTISFGILFPLAAMLVRFVPYKGQIWVHAMIQAVAYVLFIIGLIFGVWLAKTFDMMKNPHSVLGLIVFIGFFFQFPLGLMHHYVWQKRQDRSIYAHLHLWIGRVFLIIGAINGGLGIQLAAKYGVEPVHLDTVYIVLVAVFYSLWFFVSATAIVRGRHGAPNFETGEKLLPHAPHEMTQLTSKTYSP